jgi:hypothetical protein
MLRMLWHANIALYGCAFISERGTVEGVCSERTVPPLGMIRSQLRYPSEPYLWDLQILERPVPASVYTHLRRYSLLTPHLSVNGRSDNLRDFKT